MTYNTSLVYKIRDMLAAYHTEEKDMFGSRCFMVNGKMCITVGKDRLMCRLSDTDYQTALTMEGVQPMIHGGRIMKGYVFVSDTLVRHDADLKRWLEPALAYNKILTGTKHPANNDALL